MLVVPENIFELKKVHKSWSDLSLTTRLCLAFKTTNLARNRLNFKIINQTWIIFAELLFLRRRSSLSNGFGCCRFLGNGLWSRRSVFLAFVTRLLRLLVAGRFLGARVTPWWGSSRCTPAPCYCSTLFSGLSIVGSGRFFRFLRWFGSGGCGRRSRRTISFGTSRTLDRNLKRSIGLFVCLTLAKFSGLVIMLEEFW